MKKSSLLLIFCASFFSSISFSQGPVFIKSYGNSGYDFGRDILQTSDTGYVATGSSSSFTSGTADAFLLKVDSLGEFEWSYDYGGSGADWGEKVVITQDSAYALSGYTNSFGAGGFDCYVVRTDINGVPLWEKTFGGSDWDRAYSLVELPDSGFVVVGETYSEGEGEADMYVFRIDKDGNEVWSTTYGGAATDFASDVYLLGDSVYVVGGTSSFGAGMLDGLIVNMAWEDGTIGSTKTIGQEGDDYFNSITGQEEYFIMGGSRSYHHFEDCDCGLDFWAYKVDTTSLAVIADTTWDGEQIGEDIIHDITLNGNNDIFYGGSTTSWGSVDVSSGATDAYLGKFLNTYFSAFDYVKNFGEQGDDVIYGVDFCYDNGLVGVGNMRFSSTGGTNMIIVRVDQTNSTGIIDVETVEIEQITLSTPALQKDLSSQVFPTIVDDFIQISGIEEVYTISVIDLNGRLVQTFSNQQGNQMISLSSLAKGSYFLEVMTTEARNITKFVKN